MIVLALKISHQAIKTATAFNKNNRVRLPALRREAPSAEDDTPPSAPSHKLNGSIYYIKAFSSFCNSSIWQRNSLALAFNMDLQADVKAYLQTLTEEQRAAWMVNLQLSYASRTAPQASHSSEPSQSMASLPIRAEESLDTHHTWEPPDDQELAQYAQAPQPNAQESSEEESGTTHQFHEHIEPSDHGSVQQPEEELTHEAAALPPSVQATEPPAPSAFVQQAQPVDTTGDEPQLPTSTVQRSPKQLQSLPSTIHITWTRTSRHTSCSLQTMRWTPQPQPQQGSPCLQPHALPGLLGQMSGGWQSLSLTQTALATSPSLPALAG